MNMLYLCFSERYLNLSRVFLFWKEGGGGGIEQKSLKKFAPPVQFLTDLTPLAGMTLHHVANLNI